MTEDLADSSPDNPPSVDGAAADRLPQLDSVEERVLGALIEKQMTTPEYYPMSLNALTNACNQKTNRNPVVEFDDRTVARALESLRENGLVRIVSGADQRVPKYRHVFDEALGLGAAHTAVLGELMVRGPQTVGELRGRASRMHPFTELPEVEAVLDELAARDGGPAVRKLPRQPGRKESRFAHLLAGEPQTEDGADVEREPEPEAAVLQVRAENERLRVLEESVASLRAEVDDLRQQLDSFRQQFD